MVSIKEENSLIVIQPKPTISQAISQLISGTIIINGKEHKITFKNSILNQIIKDSKIYQQ